MIDYEKGIVSRGNFAAIQKCMLRAASGHPITVGFLGGSITQGSLASRPEYCYAARVYRWWQETFPLSEITLINAGIGGTTSQFGAARVEEDLLNEVQRLRAENAYLKKLQALVLEEERHKNKKQR